MSKIIATGLFSIFAAAAVQALAQTPSESSASLDSIQGAWWSDCQSPAAEFVVDGDEYFGDFSGSYKLELKEDVLVFGAGLIDGHGVNVTHKPLAFRVLKASSGQLILHPLPGNPYVGDWRLMSCNDMPSNNSFKPKPLRGSA